jgi:endonuclease/exonuclease/phosphatase (EEP) superfamily protein YafD
MPSTRALVGGAAWALASALLGVVVLRLLGWSRGPVTAVVLVGLPLVLLPSYVLAAVAVARRDRLLGGVAALLVAAHVLAVAPGLTAADVPAEADRAARLRVVTANLLVGNPHVAEAAAAVRRLDADVLVAVELQPSSLAALRRAGVLADLPHSTVEGSPEDVELFSRLPLHDVERARAVPELPQPRAVVQVAGVDVRIRGAHPLPPIHGYEATGRRSLAELLDEVRAEDLPLVVAGDLNADRHLPVFDDLLAEGLRDAAEERGRGLSRTWPQRLPLLALDHVLVRDGAQGRLVVRDQREAALPGSDHLAVVADLAVLPT